MLKKHSKNCVLQNGVFVYTKRNVFQLERFLKQRPLARISILKNEDERLLDRFKI